MIWATGGVVQTWATCSMVWGAAQQFDIDGTKSSRCENFCAISIVLQISDDRLFLLNNRHNDLQNLAKVEGNMHEQSLYCGSTDISSCDRSLSWLKSDPLSQPLFHLQPVLPFPFYSCIILSKTGSDDNNKNVTADILSWPQAYCNWQLHKPVT
jgi:hypothetical protein